MPASRSKAGRPGKSPAKWVPEYLCLACRRIYRRKALRQRSWSSLGTRRAGGGPTGAWREVWLCCPQGHRQERISFKIS